MTAIMETSEQIDAIAKVLPKAQAAMGEVFKNASNPAFKTRYANLAAVIEAVVPALNQHGVTLLQPTSFDGENVHVSTMLLHDSGQWVRCTLSAPLSKRDAQGIGSACTYLRRYGLQTMSGVAPEDDDGNAASGPGPNAQARPEPKRTDPKPPTLAERAARLETTLRGLKTADEVRKAYALASKLCAELDASDPERLAEIEALYGACLADLEMRNAA